MVRQETWSYSTCFGKRPIHYAYEVFMGALRFVVLYFFIFEA